MSQHLLRALMMLIPKGAPPGQQAYTTAGTFSWTCPAGVTSVSVVCVGAGGPTGNGGSLGYKNNITVVPGVGYTVKVGTGTALGENCYFIDATTVQGESGLGSPGHTGDGGGNGGYSGGGAGGYIGNGGNGGSASDNSVAGDNGSGGGGGGGAAYDDSSGSGPWGYGGGGGVGILGQGSNGSGGANPGNVLGPSSGGGGGSSGATGGASTTGHKANGGLYGGGCGRGSVDGFGTSAGGAVRIIWPGDVRQFPSTRTTDE